MSRSRGSRRRRVERWEIAFYSKPGMTQPPARAFLDRCPEAVAQNLLATVIAVRDRPPPSFPAGTAVWRVMKGSMGGIYEARDRHGDHLYRLFCVLDSKAPEFSASAPLLVLLCGGVKAVRTTMDDDVYEEACVYRQDYLSSQPRNIEPP